VGGRGQGWAFSLLRFIIERLRAQAFGLLDTKAGVCPTPISSPVAKGHARPCPRPPKSSFISSIHAVKAWQIVFLHHHTGGILPPTFGRTVL